MQPPPAKRVEIGAMLLRQDPAPSSAAAPAVIPAAAVIPGVARAAGPHPTFSSRWGPQGHLSWISLRGYGGVALPHKLLCCVQRREHLTGRAQGCQQCLQRGGASFRPDGELLGGIVRQSQGDVTITYIMSLAPARTMGALDGLKAATQLASAYSSSSSCRSCTLIKAQVAVPKV